MKQNVKDITVVIGHKNPDTDSICSAICYAELKHRIDGREYIPARAGEVNNETAFVLDYFGVKAPRIITNITTQVRDIEIRDTPGVNRTLSIKRAWQMMQERDVVTLPIVDGEGEMEGLITVSDIAHNIMDVYDNRILSRAHTLYSNILDTIDGEMILGDPSVVLDEGKVLIAAANPDLMENYIEKNDIVIVGNRYESQLCAIEMEARCIIVCEGSPVSKTIRKMAQARECYIISTPYDAFTVSSLINQSISIGYFMKDAKKLTMFDDTDYIDEVSDVMKNKRYRDFPIIGGDGKYIGMISRRNLLGAQGKKVILVDHNERNQCVSGIEYADIQEIIDHHRIGALETISPVFFLNRPVGCTATIIYQQYKQYGFDFDRKTAGLLCSAILSDTLMFRSPTCTEIDEAAVRELAPIAGINVEEYADQMFSAAGDLEGKSIDEIFYQDFKRFNAGNVNFGVGQVVSMNRNELLGLKERLLPFMEQAREDLKLDIIYFMLTNVLSEASSIISAGEGASELIYDAFRGSAVSAVPHSEDPELIHLIGVMSRKKQLVPRIITALQDRKS